MTNLFLSTEIRKNSSLNGKTNIQFANCTFMFLFSYMILEKEAFYSVVAVEWLKVTGHFLTFLVFGIPLGRSSCAFICVFSASINFRLNFAH